MGTKSKRAEDTLSKGTIILVQGLRIVIYQQSIGITPGILIHSCTFVGGFQISGHKPEARPTISII